MHKDTDCFISFDITNLLAKCLESPQTSMVPTQIRKYSSEGFSRYPDFVRSLNISCAIFKERNLRNRSNIPTGWGPIGSLLTLKSGTATKAPLYLSRSIASRKSRAA